MPAARTLLRDERHRGRLRPSRGEGVRLRSPGPVTVVGGPNDGGKALYLEDPDGNAVELVQLARPWPGGED